MNDFTQPTSITIPAKPEYASIARLVVAAFAGLMGFDTETVDEIKIAVSEACTNAILLLSKEYRTEAEEHEVKISAYAMNESLIIDVAFAGRDGASLEKSQMQLEERDLGMSILTSIMDKVEILRSREEGIVLRLAKRIPA